MTTPLEVRLINFSGESCPVCVGMERSGTIEKFVARHPEVKVVKLLINNKSGESPAGTDYAKNFKLSDAYGVEVVPTLVFETKGGGELLRFEGGASLKELAAAARRSLASPANDWSSARAFATTACGSCAGRRTGSSASRPRVGNAPIRTAVSAASTAGRARWIRRPPLTSPATAPKDRTAFSRRRR